ncbi:LysE family translocator [Arthrobacter monumenti]
MTLSSYLAFCGLCVVLAVTPGPESLLALRYSLRRVTAGLAASCGSALGNLMWAALVGIGLASLIEQSAVAYRVLKILGGLYLIYLGIQAFRGPRPDKLPADAGKEAIRSAGLPAFGAGLLSCMMNPKVGLFYIAIVPQFLPRNGSVFATTMLLGATLGAIILIYLVVLCLVAAKANAWLNRPRVTRNLERSSGAILAALGVGTAASAVVET